MKLRKLFLIALFLLLALTACVSMSPSDMRRKAFYYERQGDLNAAAYWYLMAEDAERQNPMAVTYLPEQKGQTYTVNFDL